MVLWCLVLLQIRRFFLLQGCICAVNLLFAIVFHALWCAGDDKKAIFFKKKVSKSCVYKNKALLLQRQTRKVAVKAAFF